MKLRYPAANRAHSRNKFCIRNFRYNSTSSLEPSIRLIVPEKNPYITAMEPEHGMVIKYNAWVAALCICRYGAWGSFMSYFKALI